uniref:SCAN box domain-containing protein n=1 Tax=Oryzias sinensis TaxID=183150 RepID=A0A8C7WWW2_9TELE
RRAIVVLNSLEIKNEPPHLGSSASFSGGTPSHYGVRSGIAEETTKRRNISPGTCCLRLRSVVVPSGRGPAGACCRLKVLCRGWDRPEQHTEEQSGRIVAMGQQPQVHPSSVRTWVEEHEPEVGPTDALPAELSGRLRISARKRKKEDVYRSSRQQVDQNEAEQGA